MSPIIIPAPLSKEFEELRNELVQRLADLHRRYSDEARPITDALALIECVRGAPTIIVSEKPETRIIDVRPGEIRRQYRDWEPNH